MDYYDKIYYSLIGELTQEAALAWVPNAFAPESKCDKAYALLLESRNRVLAKLGTDCDPDLEQMLIQMDTIQHTLCRKILSLPR